MHRIVTRMRSRVVVGLTTALAVVLACASKTPADARTTTKTTGAPRVQIQLQIPNDRFIVGEDIALHVSVTNDAAGDVSIPDPFYRDNWQPTYTITGPASPGGRTFSFRSA